MHHLFHPSMLRGQRLRFSIGVIALFLIVFGLALTQGSANASSDRLISGTVPPGGTIPPGTIPPGPGPVFYGLINVIHAAPIDSDINNTAIDICDVDSDAKVGGPLVYGEETGYEEQSLGVYDWFIAPAGSNCGSEMYDIPPFTINAGAKLVLVIYGGANGHPLTTVLIVADGGKLIRFLPLVRNEP